MILKVRKKITKTERDGLTDGSFVLGLRRRLRLAVEGDKVHTFE